MGVLRGSKPEPCQVFRRVARRRAEQLGQPRLQLDRGIIGVDEVRAIAATFTQRGLAKRAWMRFRREAADFGAVRRCRWILGRVLPIASGADKVDTMQSANEQRAERAKTSRGCQSKELCELLVNELADRIGPYRVLEVLGFCPHR